MRRDPELIRRLLLQVHTSEKPEHRITPDSDPQTDWPVLREHLRLAEECGLIEVLYMVNNPAWCVRLTSDGHDFCEEVADEPKWKKVLAWIAEKGAAPTIQAIVTTAAKLAAERLMR